MRVSPGRLIIAVTCCAAAVPTAIAQATSTGAALSIGGPAGSASAAPVRLTADPARPAVGRHARQALHRVRARRRAAHVSHAGLSGRVTARVAGDPGVTIADFHFSPDTTTIHVGDTITWSNNGPSSHTASATGGSFNTGILKKGQSASHTFTQAGTFAYVCQIHPFMHGTIVVLAATPSTAASGTTTAATTTAATTPTATTAATPAGPTLPNTGFNVLAGLCAGLVLLGLGTGLRRTRAGVPPSSRGGR